jgi:hypothetical protein
MEFYKYPNIVMKNVTDLPDSELEYMCLDIESFLDLSKLDKEWWPKNLKGLHIKVCICFDASLSIGEIIPPTYLPDTLRALSISYISSCTSIELLDETPEQYIFLNQWPLPINIEILSLFADKIYGELPLNLPNLKKLYWREDTDDFDDILSLYSLNIPDSVQYLQVTSNKVIDYTNFIWPRELKTLIVSTDEWATPLPHTLENFTCTNKSDEGPLEIEKDYKFPENLKTLSISSWGEYTSDIEPNWPTNLEKLHIHMSESCPFNLYNIPKSLKILKLDCLEINLNLLDTNDFKLQVAEGCSVLNKSPLDVETYDPCSDENEDVIL